MKNNLLREALSLELSAKEDPLPEPRKVYMTNVTYSELLRALLYYAKPRKEDNEN